VEHGADLAVERGWRGVDLDIERGVDPHVERGADLDVERGAWSIWKQA
jgi:hypothetical protein